MKVFVCQPHGYCEGVIKAINLALKTRENYPLRPIYIIGMLVHNEHVNNILLEHKITTLDYTFSELKDVMSELPSESIVVFTAHGHPASLESYARKLNLTIVDATCSYVSDNLHLIQEATNNGQKVIYIGKENHPETLSALSIGKNVFLYRKDDLDYYRTFCQDSIPPLVINQTTLAYDSLLPIHYQIRNVIPQAIFAEEICPATRLRQNAVKNIPQEVDAILVVGSKRSANTNHLVSIAKESHPKAEVYLIDSINDLDLTKVRHFKFVAVSAGASTPLEVTEKVISALKAIE
jgi:4-hydroxy-3-methylbut-2-enyl diphosphate reductase